MDPNVLISPLLQQGALGIGLVAVAGALIYVFRGWRADQETHRETERQNLEWTKTIVRELATVIENNTQSRRESVEANRELSNAQLGLKEVLGRAVDQLQDYKDISKSIERLLERVENSNRSRWP